MRSRRVLPGVSGARPWSCRCGTCPGPGPGHVPCGMLSAGLCVSPRGRLGRAEAQNATTERMTTTLELPLAGPSGEPVHFMRTIASHGVADLPPGRVDDEQRAYETTVAIRGARPRTVRITEGGPALARIDVRGARLSPTAGARVLESVRRMLNLDEDLSDFYAVAANDPDLAWATRGAGRMLRTPTVFEAVAKTICTTNCAWSATVRMVSALVSELGEVSATGDARAFPAPAAMAQADETFYRDVVRAGYRGAYLRAVAAQVASGEVGSRGTRDHPGRQRLRRRGRGAAARLAGDRPVRGGAHHDADRPALAPHPGLVDAADLRAADWPQGKRRADPASLPSLRPLRGPRFLALPDA